MVENCVGEGVVGEKVVEGIEGVCVVGVCEVGEGVVGEKVVEGIEGVCVVGK